MFYVCLCLLKRLYLLHVVANGVSPGHVVGRANASLNIRRAPSVNLFTGDINLSKSHPCLSSSITR